MADLLRHSKNMYVHYDDVIRVVLAGDSKVGKSKILSRLVENDFNSDYTATVGVDFGSKTVRTKDGKRLKLQLWDTSGQERFQSVTTAYFPGAHAILLVYDVTNSRSFEDLQYWMRVVETNCEDGVTLLVVGSKADQEDVRMVNRDTAESYAKELGALHTEVSAQSGQGVRDLFLMAVDTILRAKESKTEGPEGEERYPVRKARGHSGWGEEYPVRKTRGSSGEGNEAGFPATKTRGQSGVGGGYPTRKTKENSGGGMEEHYLARKMRGERTEEGYPGTKTSQSGGGIEELNPATKMSGRSESGGEERYPVLEAQRRAETSREERYPVTKVVGHSRERMKDGYSDTRTRRHSEGRGEGGYPVTKARGHGQLGGYLVRNMRGNSGEEKERDYSVTKTRVCSGARMEESYPGTTRTRRQSGRGSAGGSAGNGPVSRRKGRGQHEREEAYPATKTEQHGELRGEQRYPVMNMRGRGDLRGEQEYPVARTRGPNELVRQDGYPVTRHPSQSGRSRYTKRVHAT